MSMIDRAPSVHEALFRALWKCQPAVELDPAGRLLEANEQFLDLVGYELGELRGQALANILFSGEARRVSSMTALNRLREGIPQSLQFRCTTRDGRPVWLQSSSIPVTTRAKPPSCCCAKPRAA